MDSEDEAELMQCDCCGEWRDDVAHVFVMGMDTYACDKCRGLE